MVLRKAANGKQISYSNLKRRVCWCTKKQKLK